MPIEFLVGEDGNAIAAAEKIKIIFLDKQKRENPYVKYRIAPDQSEGFNSGGGKYTFRVALGEKKAGRRGAAPTDNKVEFIKPAGSTEKTLTVTQPLQYPEEDGKVITFQAQDKIELDGIDFSPNASAGMVSSLVVGEIEEDRNAIDTAVAAGETRNIDVTETDTLEVAKKLKVVASDYRDVSAENDNWKLAEDVNPNISHPATKFFHQNRYSFNKDEIDIHIHPSTISLFSNIQTEAGAGSPAQFMQFNDGTLTHINGCKVVENRYTPKGKVEFFTPRVFGTPDAEVMGTTIFQEKIKFYNQTGMRGEHYYDILMTNPELFTSVDIQPFIDDNAIVIVTPPTVTASEVTPTADGGTFDLVLDLQGGTATVNTVSVDNGTVSPTTLAAGTNAMTVSGLTSGQSAIVTYDVTTEKGTASGTINIPAVAKVIKN